MAREIPSERMLDTSLLDEEDIWYLWTRGRLPAGVERPEGPPARPVPDENLDETVPKSRVTPLEDQNSPTIEDSGGIVSDDDNEETYTDGWNNDQRRAELSKRGLLIDGVKADLIDRLLRDDTDALNPEDYDTVG